MIERRRAATTTKIAAPSAASTLMVPPINTDLGRYRNVTRCCPWGTRAAKRPPSFSNRSAVRAPSRTEVLIHDDGRGAQEVHRENDAVRRPINPTNRSGIGFLQILVGGKIGA